MKTLLSLTFLCIATLNGYTQRWGREFGMNYVFTSPTGSMGKVIERGHGGTMNYGFVTPDNRFSVGMNFAFSVYGHDKTRQVYEFNDGTTANMDVIVTNAFGNFGVYGNWYLKTEGNIVPYLTSSFGYSWFDTNLNIYDPDDWDHCEPVENELLLEDGTFIGTIGIGAKVDFVSLFKKITPGRFYLDAGIQYTQGGNVKYMNADASTSHHQTSDGSEVMSDFLNTQTQVVHKHHVGNVYESAVQMMDVRMGVTFRFAKR